MSAPRIGLTQIIDASPQAVWSVVSDIGSAADLLSDVDSVELLTDGAYGVGCRPRDCSEGPGGIPSLTTRAVVLRRRRPAAAPAPAP